MSGVEQFFVLHECLVGVLVVRRAYASLSQPGLELRAEALRLRLLNRLLDEFDVLHLFPVLLRHARKARAFRANVFANDFLATTAAFVDTHDF